MNKMDGEKREWAGDGEKQTSETERKQTRVSQGMEKIALRIEK